MLKTSFRTLRAVGAALLIAALPVAGLSATPAAAQVPGMPSMGDPYPLTPELVMGFIESYPDVVAYTETLEDVDLPEGEDAMAALAGIGMASNVLGQLNAIVTPFGFEDYAQWSNVAMSVAMAYGVLAAPPEARAMMAGFTSQENIDAVSAHEDEVAAFFDAL